MNRWVKAVCAVVVACSGCTESKVDVAADITLSGKALLEDKRPLANTLLSMDRSANSSCGFDILGLNWKAVKTGADGSFNLELLGADTRNGSIARCFSLRAPPGAKGRSMSVQFLIQTEQVQVPTLQEWGSTPAVAASGTGVSVTFQDIAATHESVSGAPTLVVRKKSAGTAWVLEKVVSPVTVGDFFLEDAADLQAHLFVRHEVQGSGTTFSFSYQGDEVALPQRSLVPASRGASCTYAEAPATCPLTDGDLTTAVSFKQGTREVSFQLSQPKVLRKAVLRNFDTFFNPSELVLEGSSDGATWVPLANLLTGQPEDSFLEFNLTHPSPISQVRLRGTSTTSEFYISSLSELSLFE
jgi:hypothetical protein